MAQTLALQSTMEETETNHPQKLGKVGKSRRRMFTVVHDIIVCSVSSQAKQPSYSNCSDL